MMVEPGNVVTGAVLILLGAFLRPLADDIYNYAKREYVFGDDDEELTNLSKETREIVQDIRKFHRLLENLRPAEQRSERVHEEFRDQVDEIFRVAFLGDIRRLKEKYERRELAGDGFAGIDKPRYDLEAIDEICNALRQWETEIESHSTFRVGESKSTSRKLLDKL